jgi:hypothetical protein
MADDNAVFGGAILRGNYNTFIPTRVYYIVPARKRIIFQGFDLPAAGK